MNIQKLCTDIATKEDGLEVIAILKKNNLWDDTKYWKLVGNNKDYNNHSIIGSQQSNPANALVEKLVNSGDSALMLKCLEKGIDPTYAAKLIQYGWETITEALKHGGITNMMDRLSNPAKIKQK